SERGALLLLDQRRRDRDVVGGEQRLQALLLLPRLADALLLLADTRLQVGAQRGDVVEAELLRQRVVDRRRRDPQHLADRQLRRAGLAADLGLLEVVGERQRDLARVAGLGADQRRGVGRLVGAADRD